MPRETDHQTAIVTPVCGPPILTIGHQRFDVFFDSVKIKRLDRFAMVVIGIHRVGACAVLVQDVEVQGLGPPFGDAVVSAGVATMHDRAGARRIKIVAVHECLPRCGLAKAACLVWNHSNQGFSINSNWMFLLL